MFRERFNRLLAIGFRFRCSFSKTSVFENDSDGAAVARTHEGSVLREWSGHTAVRCWPTSKTPDARTLLRLFLLSVALLTVPRRNVVSKPSFVYIVVTALFVTAGGPAPAVDQTTIDQVVNVAKIGCLLGNEFTFDAKANGDITFIKLRPGAEAGVHTNIKEDPGAPGIIDQQLKLIASQQIRDCMKPYIQKLAEIILGQASGNQITSIDASTALDLGDCPNFAGQGGLWNDRPDQTYRCKCPAIPESSLGGVGQVWVHLFIP